MNKSNKLKGKNNLNGCFPFTLHVLRFTILLLLTSCYSQPKINEPKPAPSIFDIPKPKIEEKKIELNPLPPSEEKSNSVIKPNENNTVNNVTDKKIVTNVQSSVKPNEVKGSNIVGSAYDDEKPYSNTFFPYSGTSNSTTSNPIPISTPIVASTPTPKIATPVPTSTPLPENTNKDKFFGKIG